MTAVDLVEAAFVAGKAAALAVSLALAAVVAFVVHLGRPASAPAPVRQRAAQAPMRALPAAGRTPASVADVTCRCGGEMAVDEGPDHFVAECTSCGLVLAASRPGAA